MFRRILFYALLLMLPSFAFGQDYDVREVYRQGAWTVTVTQDLRTGDQWCSAETTNRRSQTFSITAFANASAALFVFDNQWSLRDRAIDFVVDVDRSRWTMSGNAGGNGVSIFFQGNDNAGQFVEDVAAGYQVTVRNADLRALAEFSLSGSRASLNVLMDCWQYVSGSYSQDPF